MDSKLMDSVHKNMKSFMQAGMDAGKQMQDSPIGRQPRSKREMNAIMAKIMALPPEEKQVRMTEISNLAGHKGDKLDGCDLCNWIKDSLLNRGN